MNDKRCCHCKKPITGLHFQHISGNLFSCYECIADRFGDERWKKANQIDWDLVHEGPEVGESYQDWIDFIDLMDDMIIELD